LLLADFLRLMTLARPKRLLLEELVERGGGGPQSPPGRLVANMGVRLGEDGARPGGGGSGSVVVAVVVAEEVEEAAA
jgi:hypothetical protein